MLEQDTPTGVHSRTTLEQLRSWAPFLPGNLCVSYTPLYQALHIPSFLLLSEWAMACLVSSFLCWVGISSLRMRTFPPLCPILSSAFFYFVFTDAFMYIDQIFDLVMSRAASKSDAHLRSCLLVKQYAKKESGCHSMEMVCEERFFGTLHQYACMH